jgi:predicted nuclease of restriction endonuclease-like (RecB) superfamily
MSNTKSTKKGTPKSRAVTKSGAALTQSQPASAEEVKLLTDLRLMIEQAREQVAQSVNTGLVMLYWNVGRRIGQDILKEQRAEYGQRIVVTVSRQLAAEFGPGFSKPNLLNMIRFVEVFPAEQIVYALSRQLSWTHFRRIIYLKDDLKRDFYAEMCRLEGWSTRALDKKINGLLYERTALAKKPAELIRKELDALRETDRMTPDLVFRDPYILDFLKLPAEYSEQELEAALLQEIERFLLELGESF